MHYRTNCTKLATNYLLGCGSWQMQQNEAVSVRGGWP